MPALSARRLFRTSPAVVLALAASVAAAQSPDIASDTRAGTFKQVQGEVRLGRGDGRAVQPGEAVRAGERIRTGQDVFRALALGAMGTYIGRAFLYGLGADGERGVRQVLEIIAQELDVTMALCGERRVTDIGPQNLES